MNIIERAWHWLTTSRSYRLMEAYNEQLRKEVDQLRNDNRRLIMAFNPGLTKAMEPQDKPTKPSTVVPVTLTSEGEPIPTKAPIRQPVSWRTARAKLERQHNTN